MGRASGEGFRLGGIGIRAPSSYLLRTAALCIGIVWLEIDQPFILYQLRSVKKITEKLFMDM